MKTTPPAFLPTCNTAMTLQQLVSTIIRDQLPVAGNRNTRLVNEVEPGIMVTPDMLSVRSIMEELLTTVVANSSRGNIHISAERYRDLLILEIQERNNNNGYALGCRISGIEPDAAAIGGHISVNGPQQKITTIRFSFPVREMAA